MAIAKVQEVFRYTTAGGGTSVTIATPTAGNTLALWIQNINGATVSSITGGGVTWALQAAWSNAGGARTELWLGPNSSGSGTTISVSVSNFYARYDINITEWSGMPATITADGGSNTTTNNPNNLSPAITPTAGKPVLLLASDATFNQGISAGPSGGFTALNTVGGSSYGNFAYQIVGSASGSYQCGWTSTGSYGTAAAGLYAFDGATGGGATHGLFLPAPLTGLGSGGPFFANPLG